MVSYFSYSQICTVKAPEFDDYGMDGYTPAAANTKQQMTLGAFLVDGELNFLWIKLTIKLVTRSFN